MNRLYILTLACIALPLGMMAQEAADYQYLASQRLWQAERLPAGLSRDSLQTLGRTTLSGTARGGSYHHIQEGGSRTSMSFSTEQWRSVGKYLYAYGRATLQQDRIKDRAWADEYRVIKANPYISGSSILGEYSEQDFLFSAQIATRPLGVWTFGLGVDYNLGDLSRLRDPRSRVMLLDYKLLPSATWAISQRQTLGLSVGYERRKEKLTNLTTVQEDPNLRYYRMKGLDVQTNAVGGYRGFGRQWVDHSLLLSLAHSYKGDVFRSMLTLGADFTSEEVTEDAKYQPGKYRTTNTQLLWTGQWLGQTKVHSLDLKAKYNQGKADEYLSQEVNTQDPVTRINSKRWDIVITYPERYKQEDLSTSLSYKMAWVDHSTAKQKAYLGLEGGLDYYKQRYILPEKSMAHSRLSLSVLGGGTLKLSDKSRLTLDGSLGYSYSPTNQLEGLSAGSANEYLNEVILPLQEFYTARYLRTSLSAEYQHALRLGEVSRYCFVRLSGDYLPTFSPSLQRYQIGITIGLYH